VNDLHGGLSVAIEADRSIAGGKILIGNVPAQRLILLRTQEELASFAAGMKPLERECTAIKALSRPAIEAYAGKLGNARDRSKQTLGFPAIRAQGAQDRNHPALAISAQRFLRTLSGGSLGGNLPVWTGGAPAAIR
jgi:hypothetical protein